MEGPAPSAKTDKAAGHSKSMAAAFNEWMRRYIVEPDRFDREWQSVSEYIQETSEGKTPSYGESCAAYLVRLISEMCEGER